MNLTDLRAAVTLNGGTPATYDGIALLRQLVSAYGGTPTQYSVVGLIREVITAAGGAPTQWSGLGLERELVAALGGDCSSVDGRIVSGLLAAAKFGGAAISAGVTINATTSVTGWTATSGAVLATAVAPVAHPNGGTQFLEITCPVADTFVSARSTAVPASFHLSDAALIGIWIYWSAAQGSVALRFTSDNFVSKTKTFSWAWSGQLHVGWNYLTIRPGDDGTTSPGGVTWTVAGGMLDTEVVNGVEVQISTNAAVQTDIFVGGIEYYASAPARGAIVFGFDKYGEASIPTLALPILSASKIRAYWAGDGNLINGATTARGYLQTVYDAGWDAISQGMNHPDYTVAGAAQLAADYDTAAAIFLAQGFRRGSQLFSYPLSANNAATDAVLLAKGVRMARSGWSWDIRPNAYNGGPKLIGHGAVNIGGKTLTVAKALVDRAVAYGSTIFLFCHGLTAGGTGTTPPADPLYWYTSDYQALIDYAVTKRAAGLIETLSPTQWLARHQRSAPTA